MKINWRNKILIALIAFCLALAFLYVIIRVSFFIFADYAWYEKFLAFLLLLAELFGLFQSAGYFTTILAILSQGEEEKFTLPTITTYPPVMILVPSYKEPISILTETLVCFYNLTYPNKHLYLLDDTRYDKPWDTKENVAAYRKAVEEMCQSIGVNLFRRKWRAAKAGIVNDFLKFKSGGALEGLEYHHFQKEVSREEEKYVVVFDADMNPFPDFIEPLVERMEKTPKAAFIQTPQYYSNFELNRVACASGLQQVIFYEYICEGKGLSNAMFCCGTNVLIRREALDSVGGFDETSVTEDFATSLLLHLKGWTSLYYNRVSAFGLGPEDLSAYFKQQERWSKGTLGLTKKLPQVFFAERKKIGWAVWWEYLLSCTHYLIGWFFFIMFLFPTLFLFFNIPSYFLTTNLYFTVFLPYFVLSSFLSFWTLRLRGYKLSYLIKSISIGVTTTFIFMRVALGVLFNVKSAFVVTPKGQSSALPLTALWPQILFSMISVATITWGLDRIYFERDPLIGLGVNVFWALYNCVLFAAVLYFNNPEGKPWFENTAEHAAST